MVRDHKSNILRNASRMEAQALLNSAMELTTTEGIERYIRTEMERCFISAEP